MKSIKNSSILFPSSLKIEEALYHKQITRTFFSSNQDRNLDEFLSLYYCYSCSSLSKSIYNTEGEFNWTVTFKCSNCKAEWHTCKSCNLQKQPKKPCISKRELGRINNSSHQILLNNIKKDHHHQYHVKIEKKKNLNFQDIELLKIQNKK